MDEDQPKYGSIFCNLLAPALRGPAANPPLPESAKGIKRKSLKSMERFLLRGHPDLIVQRQVFGQSHFDIQ